ncbi:6-phosphogluconolactonase [Hirschia litorea]|uniref:6-phosphogluconolactonase n=1 Tax=Hirschia litorea TaxID=1199156 RepID=A0ABW2IIH5_9PROT
MAFEIFENKTDLVERAYELTYEALDVGLAQNGAASLMCSGGSTPGPLYMQLSQSDLDWSNINVGLVDDRWVAPDHDRSNEKLLRNTLLQNAGASATFYPMYVEGKTAKEALDQRAAEFAKISLPLDVVILGMGPDGHSLSWFPNADGLSTATDPANEKLIAAVMANRSAVTGDELERMTLTYNAIANSREIILLVTGDDKREVFENGDDNLPIRILQKAAGDRLTTLWAP